MELKYFKYKSSTVKSFEERNNTFIKTTFAIFMFYTISQNW